MGKVNFLYCTKNRLDFLPRLVKMLNASRLVRGREAQNYGGCPLYEDTLLIDIFGKFDFPIPEFGIYDAGAPERVIRRIAEEYFLFVGMGVADMELVHIIFPFFILIIYMRKKFKKREPESSLFIFFICTQFFHDNF